MTTQLVWDADAEIMPHYVQWQDKERFWTTRFNQSREYHAVSALPAQTVAEPEPLKTPAKRKRKKVRLSSMRERLKLTHYSETTGGWA